MYVCVCLCVWVCVFGCVWVQRGLHVRMLDPMVRVYSLFFCPQNAVPVGKEVRSL